MDGFVQLDGGAMMWLGPIQAKKIQGVDGTARTGDLRMNFGSIPKIWGSFVLLSQAPAERSFATMVGELDEMRRYLTFLDSNLTFVRQFEGGDAFTALTEVASKFSSLSKELKKLTQLDTSYIEIVKGAKSNKQQCELSYQVVPVLQEHRKFIKLVEETSEEIADSLSSEKGLEFDSREAIRRISELVVVVASKSLYPIKAITSFTMPSAECKLELESAAKQFWQSGSFLYSFMEGDGVDLRHLKERELQIEYFLELQKDLLALESTRERLLYFRDWVENMLLFTIRGEIELLKGSEEDLGEAIPNSTSLVQSIVTGLDELFNGDQSCEVCMRRAKTFVSTVYSQIIERSRRNAICMPECSNRSGDEGKQQSIVSRFIVMFRDSTLFEHLVLSSDGALQTGVDDGSGGEGGGGGVLAV